MADALDRPVPGAGLLNLTFVGHGAPGGHERGRRQSRPTRSAWSTPSSRASSSSSAPVRFLWAYALGVSRSRTDLVGIPGLFFLAGDAAPPDVRRPFRVALAVEVVAVVAAAAVRPYTEVAFGVLAPMFALGLMGTWGGRYGTFPPRPPKEPA